MTERIPRSRFRGHKQSEEIIINSPQKSVPIPAPVSELPEAQQPTAKTKRDLLPLISLVLMLALFIGGGTWLYVHKNSSPVPKAIRQSVDFPVYYPDPKKLPSGYTLNLSSFKTPIKNGVTYSVSYGNGKQLVFSVQPKPSPAELQTFDGNYLPLKTTYQTPVGQAEIGAYNLKTLVSLPTSSSTWIIITAPPNINQGQLKQVLSSIKD
jgi:hypothetical protein